MSRAREAGQQLTASYYGFDGFPEYMFVFFFLGPFSEARLIIVIIIIIIVSGRKGTESFSENEKYITLVHGKDEKWKE